LLASAALNAKTEYSRCLRLFDDILETQHACEIPWSRVSGHQGSTAILVDAQGAMLMLRRVRNLAKQDVLAAGCSERAGQIAKALQKVCENELGDMSLVGFNTKSRLAEIQGGNSKAKIEKGGSLENKNVRHMATSPESRSPQSLGGTCFRHALQKPVEGLDGYNKISYFVEGGQLQVLIR
jgi:hypothetical protein